MYCHNRSWHVQCRSKPKKSPFPQHPQVCPQSFFEDLFPIINMISRVILKNDIHARQVAISSYDIGKLTIPLSQEFPL